MVSKKKRYYQIKRLWETRGNENESFTDFLYNLESEGIITFKDWVKFTKMFEKLG